MKMFLRGNITLKEGRQSVFQTINEDTFNPSIIYYEGEWVIMCPSLVHYSNAEEQHEAFKEMHKKLDALRADLKDTLKELVGLNEDKDAG